MKLLKVTANNFKNCGENFSVDFVAVSRKTEEDKEYELLKVDDELFVFNTMAFVGKNASGKTSVLDLLDCCYSILGEFRLEGKHYGYEGIELEIVFYHEKQIYLYTTKLKNDPTLSNKAIFEDERLFVKPYYKSNVKKLYDRNTFTEMKDFGSLPEDTSKVFFILKKKQTRALFFDSFEYGADTYQVLFKAMTNYQIDDEVMMDIVRIFDDNIKGLSRIDDHNYELSYADTNVILSDAQLIYMLSSGTTKGLLLYTLVVASLKQGFDLLIDEIENHFHKTLVENIISLYKDKTVNRRNASLVFTTHYCELLDQFGRMDNIWICKSSGKLKLDNMYSDYDIRGELLKSKQFYGNAFQTAVNYDLLMKLKKRLKK
ncbi:MAG: ATP-binding protein [Clostridia bacterium]|nr:ATP-binding protein [Clostridia bacterium]